MILRARTTARRRTEVNKCVQNGFQKEKSRNGGKKRKGQYGEKNGKLKGPDVSTGNGSEDTLRKLAEDAATMCGLEPNIGAADGSGEGTAALAIGPPALAMNRALVLSQQVEAGPSTVAAAEGREPATASFTLEQLGEATREAFQRDARIKRAAALKAADDAQRAERLLRREGAAPGEGVVERTGLGVGYGIFDAVYEPPAGEMPMPRYERNYLDSSRWTQEVAQDWQARLAALTDEWSALDVTVRLFKASWQGQELSKDSIVRVLQQVLDPIGEVQGNLAVYSEMFDNRGVRANEGEEVQGNGGGMYVPIVMRNLGVGSTQEQKAQWLQLWGEVEPEGSEELGPGEGVLLWDCPAEYFTVGVPMLMPDRQEVVHNLCVQMNWHTLESVE